jgi:hypothetical protein
VGIRKGAGSWQEAAGSGRLNAECGIRNAEWQAKGTEDGYRGISGGIKFGVLGALAVQSFQIGDDSGVVEAEEDAERDRDGGAEPVL